MPAREVEPLLVGRHTQLDRALGALRAGQRGVVVRSGPAAGQWAFARSLAEQVGVPLFVQGQAATSSVSFGAIASMTEVPAGSALDAAAVRAAASDLVVAAHDGPVIVDDASQIDIESAMALVHASQRGLAMILVTGRRSQLPGPLGATAQHFEVVELTDLADAAISELAALTLGGPVEPRLIRSLTRLVGGASGALVDVLRSETESGAIERTGQVWRQRRELLIPASTTARLAVLVDQLPSDARDALDLVALVRRLPLEVLEALVGDEIVVMLEDRDLVQLVDSPSGAHVAIVDVVVGSTRRQLLGSLRRRRLARRLDAQLTSSASRGGPASDPVVLATVRLTAGTPMSVADVIDAARGARAAGDVALAIELCESVTGDARSSGLAILLAEFLTETGHNRRAESILRAVTTESDEERALIAMARAVNLGLHLDDVDAAITLLEDAIDQNLDEPWTAEAIGLRAVFELMLGRPHEAIRRAEPFLARPAGREFVEAATAAAPALVVLGQCERAAELAAASLEERLRLGDQTFLESAGLHALMRGLGLAEAGRFADADALTDFVLGAASEIGATSGVMWAGVIRGRSMLDQGRYLEAAELFDLASSGALDLNLGLQLRWARGGALLAFAQMGDRQGVRRALHALEASPPTPLMLMASEVERARAWAALASGDLRLGSVRLLDAADVARASGESGMEALALHDLVRVGVVDHIDRLLALAGELEGPLHTARVAHGRALATDDARALADVGDEFERLGAVVLAAEATNQASWSERRRGRLASSERLLSDVRALHGRCPAAATPGLASHLGLASLTPREREVAMLVAGGSSSKEVAQRLGVSVRTVDNLLQRVYRKLGVAGRSDLKDLRAD